ncbi:unnamed protein product [Calypogeia fissa]
MIDDDIGVDLPMQRDMQETTPNGTKRFDIFRSHAELAMLESRIYTELYSVKARNRSHLERLRSVGRLDMALLEWKEKLPVEIRPEEPIQCAKEQEVPVAMLHFAYFNCLITIHRISNSGSWTGRHAKKDLLSLDDGHLNPRIYASHSICLSTARASIRLLKIIDIKGGTVRDHVIWMAIYYPLSNFLILFANLLLNPEDPYVSSDLSLMELVRSFLSPRAARTTPFHANVTIKIFAELVNVARRFVDKVSSQGMNKAKRTHENENKNEEKLATTDSRIQATTSTSTNPPFVSSTAATDIPAFGSQPLASNTLAFQPPPAPHLPSYSTEMPYPTTNNVSLPNAEDTSTNFPESINTIYGQGLGLEAPMFSESFEWDLANLWTSEFVMQSFENLEGI